MAFHQCGLTNTIGICGTAFTMGYDSRGFTGEPIVWTGAAEFTPNIDFNIAEANGYYLSKYEDGINISDEVIDEIEGKGGIIPNPTVDNKAEYNMWVLSEEGGKLSLLEKGENYYAPIDGFKTSAHDVGKAYKIRTGGWTSVHRDGSYFIYGGIKQVGSGVIGASYLDKMIKLGEKIHPNGTMDQKLTYYRHWA